MDISVIILIVMTVGGFFFGILPYVIDTIRGKTQPNRITWLLWSIPLLVVIAQWLEGSITWGSLTIFFAGFSPILIFLASFVNPKAYWKLEKFDYFCAFLALVAIVTYIFTRDVFIAVLLTLITDGFAALPTLKKSYSYPHIETVWPFFMGIIDNILVLFVMERYDFVEMAFPLYLILICIVFVYLLRSQLSFSLFKK